MKSEVFAHMYVDNLINEKSTFKRGKFSNYIHKKTSIREFRTQMIRVFIFKFEVIFLKINKVLKTQKMFQEYRFLATPLSIDN